MSSVGPLTNVAIGELRELDRIFVDDEALLLAALAHTRLDTDPTVRRHLPLLADAASHIGHAAIPNRGTLGGSLAHADAAAELPAVMVALWATL